MSPTNEEDAHHFSCDSSELIRLTVGFFGRKWLFLTTFLKKKLGQKKYSGILLLISL